MKRYLSVFLFLLVAWIGRAQAITPETGVWWNPNANGSGYGIEIQDNVLVISMWVYAPNGAPIYYISAGAMTGDRNYSGPLVTYSGGQCVGCAYNGPPTTVPFGNIAVTFDSPSTGAISINDAAPIPIQRFAYAIDPQSYTALFGEWALVEGSKSFPVYSGERIQFASTHTSSDGEKFAGGNRSGASTRLAVGHPTGSGNWTILLDSSTSYYSYYQFRFSGLNTIEGTSWTHLKTSSPSGSGTPFIGFRSRSASVVKTGVGPGISTQSAKPSIADDAAEEAQNSLRATAPENAEGQHMTEEALIAYNILRGLLPR